MLRKWLMSCFAVVFLFLTANACDICGCSSGAGFTGILPQFHKNFAGLRYTYRPFRTSHFTDDGSDLVSHDVFQSLEGWGRFYAHPRVQLFAVIPVNLAAQSYSGSVMRTAGPGDIQVYANYALVLTPDTAESYLRQTLLLGGGLKLPTGENNLTRKGIRLIQPLQPGTGSWDFLLNGIYTIRYRMWGMNLDANLRITSTNAQGYKFGNRANGSVKFFYWARRGRLSVLPQFGILTDYGVPDTDKGFRIPETGGLSLMGTAGIDFYYGRLVGGFTFQQPVYQNLGGGAVSALQRYSAHLAVLF